MGNLSRHSFETVNTPVPVDIIRRDSNNANRTSNRPINIRRDTRKGQQYSIQDEPKQATHNFGWYHQTKRTVHKSDHQQRTQNRQLLMRPNLSQGCNSGSQSCSFAIKANNHKRRTNEKTSKRRRSIPTSHNSPDKHLHQQKQKHQLDQNSSHLQYQHDIRHHWRIPLTIDTYKVSDYWRIVTVIAPMTLSWRGHKIWQNWTYICNQYYSEVDACTNEIHNLIWLILIELKASWR